MRTIATLLTTAALLLTPSLARAAESLVYLTPTQIGFGSAQNLSATPESSPIVMQGNDGTFNQVTWVMSVTWGTSTQVRARCRTSGDGSNYSWIARCTDASPHDCTIREWLFTAANWADGKLLLNVPSNYRYMRCRFDDPADGTGTITGHALKGRQ